MKRLFVSLTLALGVIVTVYALAVHQGFFLRGAITELDQSVLDLTLVQRGETRSAAFLFFTYLANWEIIASLSLVVITLLLLARKSAIALMFAATLIAGQSLSLLFKELLSRSRPDTMHALIEQAGYSFPSGHALGSVIFYGMLAYFTAAILKRHRYHIFIATGAALLIIFIGFSRLYLGVHWFSDIIAGWILGGALLVLFTAFFKRRKTLFTASPLPPLVSKPLLILIAVILVAAEIYFISWYYLTHPLP